MVKAAGKLEDVKMQEVEGMVRLYREQRSEHEELERQFKEAKAKTDNTGSRLLSVLDAFKMTTHKTVYGKITRNERWSWKQPKDDDSREELRKFLESRGEFENLWSVNSRTLNSRAKSWLEEAVDEGNIDFAIPGLTEPTVSAYLSFSLK